MNTNTAHIINLRNATGELRAVAAAASLHEFDLADGAGAPTVLVFTKPVLRDSLRTITLTVSFVSGDVTRIRRTVDGESFASEMIRREFPTMHAFDFADAMFRK